VRLILPRRRSALAMTAIIAVALVASGISVVRNSDSPAPASASKKDRSPGGCALIRQNKKSCHVIRVDGQAYRYVLIRRGASRDTTLIDIGGPGSAPLGAGYPRDLMGSLTTTNALLIDEPWTTAKSNPKCDVALSTWYTDLRASWPASESTANLRSIKSDCHLFTDSSPWGFTATRYRDLVQQIAKTEHITLTNFYGFSFGAVRWNWSASLFRSALLVSPFPAGMPAAEYVSSKNSEPVPSVDLGVLGAKPPGRSLPISTLDISAAQMQSLYLDPRARAELFTSADAPRVVGKLSDQLFGRYGTASIAHSLLAFWDETCPALADWPKSSMASQGLAGELLSMCSLQPPSQPIALTKAQPDCVAFTRNDGVLPDATRVWLRKTRNWPTEIRVPGGHASSAGLESCIRRSEARQPRSHE
jgi:hypothetical protein